MRILNKMRRQQCVYWAPTAPDPYGQPQYADPIQLRVRWTDKEAIDTKEGTSRITSTTKVYTDQDLLIDGLLMLGTLDDVQEGKPRAANPMARPIQDFNKIPTLKADDFVRVAYL